MHKNPFYLIFILYNAINTRKDGDRIKFHKEEHVQKRGIKKGY